MASLYAQKNLSTAQTSLSQSVQRLSSGTRIGSAKDDAAGFGISQSVSSTKNIADQNVRNIQNGISWAQTADGALDVVGKILQRSLTLFSQSQDKTLNSTQLASIGTELTALSAEVANVQARTKVQGGGANLFAAAITVDTGSGTATTVTATMVSMTAFNTAAGLIGGGTAATGTQLTDLQALIATNATNRSTLGAAINSLQYAIDNTQTLSNNLADSVGRIVDTDYAAETANLTRTQILQQAATSMLAQANQMPNVILTLLK
jgi:flagellin